MLLLVMLAVNVVNLAVLFVYVVFVRSKFFVL